MRCAMTRVLPDPAPARINSGPSLDVTASRCCGLSCERKSVMRNDELTFKHTTCSFRTVKRARDHQLQAVSFVVHTGLFCGELVPYELSHSIASATSGEPNPLIRQLLTGAASARTFVLTVLLRSNMLPGLRSHFRKG